MICANCKIEKQESEFSWKVKSKNIRHKRCKSCVSELVKKHYINNKDKYKEKATKNNKVYINRNRDFILDYLKNHPCVDCGNNNPIVLDFDHVTNTKLKNISRMKIESFSLEKIKEEIAKCEVRCSNCHRIITHDRILKRKPPIDRGTPS